MLKHVCCLQADVDGIDLEARHVSLAYGVHRERKVLAYEKRTFATRRVEDHAGKRRGETSTGTTMRFATARWIPR
jgi:hypothetical protein